MKTFAGSKRITIPGIRATLLDNERHLYVYVPEGYERDTERRYPVLYMHVGQHVFEPSKESGEAWRMHEVLDRLIAEKKMEEIILVAVEHIFEEGTSEYFHELCAYPIACTGEQYEHFLVHELKPYIDAAFRTLRGPKHTALMGSSAAGIATYNIGLRNPDVFGMLGILSPFFVQVDPQTFEEISQYRLYDVQPTQKLWLDIGGAEGFFMTRHVKAVASALLRTGYEQGRDLYYYHEPEAAHSETDWGRRAHMPLLYFFGKQAKPQQAALYGGDTVGLTGSGASLNAVVTLDNGLSFSDLEGEYVVTNPGIVQVDGEGRLIALSPGTTEVIYRYGELTATKHIRVIPELSEYVTLDMEILVPDTTPEDARIYATFEIPKIRSRLYGGKIRLPRGLMFEFIITRGYDQEEVDEDFRQIPRRTIVTDKDQTIRYQVLNWSDLRPGAVPVEGGAVTWKS